MPHPGELCDELETRPGILARAGAWGTALDQGTAAGEEVTVTRTYELRLREMAVPDGEIAVADLGTLCVRLQDLSTKVGRWVAEIAGPRS